MFDADEFWLLARELLRDARAGEGHCHTAASRAYYAFFLIARDHLRLPLAHNASDHVRVLFELRRRGRIRLANDLASLRRLRELADYDRTIVVNRSDVMELLEDVEAQYQQVKRL